MYSHIIIFLKLTNEISRFYALWLLPDMNIHLLQRQRTLSAKLVEQIARLARQLASDLVDVAGTARCDNMQLGLRHRVPWITILDRIEEWTGQGLMLVR